MNFRGSHIKITFSFLWVYKIAFVFLFSGLLLAPVPAVYGQDTANTASPQVPVKKDTPAVPEISDIIPLGAKIEVKLIRTQKILRDTINEDALVSSFKSIDEKLDTLGITLNNLKTSGPANFNSLKTFKIELLAVTQNFKDANIPLSKEIAKIETQRKMWLEEQENWTQWEDTLVTKNTPKQIRTTFKKSQIAINTALKSLVPKLDQLLILQDNSYKIQPKIDILTDEFDLLSKQEKEQVLLDESDSMFSSKFRDKFTPELWENTKKGFVEIKLTNKFNRTTYFWGVLLGLFLFLTVYLILKKNNEAILNSSEYKFLANKALSSALFISVTTVFLIFKYETMQPSEELLIAVIIGVSFCFVLKDRLTSWKKQIVYLFVLLVLLDNFFFTINLPTPLFRTYIAFISLSLIVLSVLWFKKSKTENNHKFWSYLLFIGALYFGIVFLTEITGKEVLALYLFDSLIRTAIIITLYAVYLFIIRGALEWILLKFNSNQKYLSPEVISSSVNRLTMFISILAIVFLLLPQLLITWGVYSNMKEADDSLMALGFNVGDNEITLQLVITAICVLYGSFIISSLFSRFIMNETFDKKNFDKGTRLSIAQLVHYFIMFVGFIVAISVLGFNLTNFTIVLSALSVGIGFGLQGIVNNFIGGLILLFERPIREGDSIEMQGVPWSTVKEIGLRSTRLITYEKGDLIVPNSELIYKNVTNWTLSNRMRNLVLPVGVAYGSDISLVINTLMEIGKESDSLAKNSNPVVLFRSFGDSVLNFELRVLVSNVENGLSIKSSIYQDIYQRFDKANIQIAYPQLDVHLYNADKSNVAKTEPKAKDN